MSLISPEAPDQHLRRDEPQAVADRLHFINEFKSVAWWLIATETRVQGAEKSSLNPAVTDTRNADKPFNARKQCNNSILRLRMSMFGP